MAWVLVRRPAANDARRGIEVSAGAPGLYHWRVTRPTATLAHELRFTHVPTGARIAWARSGRRGAQVLVRTAHWMTHVEHDLRSPLWQSLIERLSRPFELLRYDERGCGLSTADDTPPSLETSVAELEAVTRAHGGERFGVLGISSGAPTAVAFAARHPQRVSHLVLLGGFTHGALHRNLSADDCAYFEAQIRLIELGWGRPEPAVQQLFSSRYLPGGTAEQLASFNQHQRLCCGAAQAAAIARARASLDVRALLPLVRTPTLVMHCEGDIAVPLAHGHELAAGIHGARFEMLPSRNHIPLGHEPAFERLCEAITDFVVQRPPTPPLAPRERDLARLVGQGLDNPQIAAHLGLADKTVRNRLSSLYAKLGVDGRAMAVARVRDMGL